MKLKRTFALLLFLLILIQISGCSQVAGVSTTATPSAAPSTSTPQPTATETLPPTPTPTSAPTSTATPVPSPTTDRTATAIAEETAVMDAINALISPELEEYGVNPKDGHIVWVQPDRLKLDLTSYLENKDYPLKDVGKVSDFVIESKVTWNTSGALSLCGITFHAEDDFAKGAQNRFFMMRLQYSPGWTIWRWNYGQFQNFATGSWLPSGKIHDDNSSSNVVALVSRGINIDVFINHDKQRRVEDTKLKEGLLALSANQESGKTTCKFDNTWVWVFDK